MHKDLVQKRLSKTRFVGRVIARLPFVSCVILNGSLASGTSKQSSDIDILIIAKDNHIFTARFFVLLFAIIIRIKRSKDRDKSHAGKFCFNYFLTESFLEIPTGRGEEMNRYCADNYSRSQYIAGDTRLFKKFLNANSDLFGKFGYSVPLQRHPRLDLGSRKLSKDFSALDKPHRGVEMTKGRAWTIKCFDWFENVLRKYQIKKIESDPRTQKYPELIAYNDKELRFHPPK